VGEHADDLVRGIGLHQRADIDEDAVPARHERVEGLLVDEDDLRRPGVKAGRAEDRLRVVAQELLGFGVADDRQLARPLLRSRTEGREGHAACRQSSNKPAYPERRVSGSLEPRRSSGY
jgi:hypothetical protein